MTDAAIVPTELDKTGEGAKVNNPGDVVLINQQKHASIDDAVIVKAFEDLAEVDKQRSDLNDDANNIRQKLKDLGLPPAAINAAYARFKKSDAARAKIDAAFAKCCKATGTSYQPGLFG